MEVDGAGDALGAWPRARLRKSKTAINATNTTAQKTNIPRDEGGGRFGNWIIVSGIRQHLGPFV